MSETLYQLSKKRDIRKFPKVKDEQKKVKQFYDLLMSVFNYPTNYYSHKLWKHLNEVPLVEILIFSSKVGIALSKDSTKEYKTTIFKLLGVQ